ncbi:MAG: AAA family ATPase [Candidatus Micrarchaeia archaeon]
MQENKKQELSKEDKNKSANGKNGDGTELKFQLARIKAIGTKIAQNPQFWQGLLISGGFISFALFFPFYGMLLPLIAIALFIIGYHHPIFGTVASFLCILPAVSYQVPVFSWLFLLAIGLVFFLVFNNWYIIAALLFMISAPFAPQPYNLILGPLTVLVFAVTSLYLGSKKTLYVLPVTFYLILLLSAFWNVQNSAFLTLSSHSFVTNRALIPSKYEPEMLVLAGEIPKAIGNMFSPDVMREVNTLISIWGQATMDLFFADTGLLQIIAWSIVFFLLAYLPIILYGKWSQFVPSLVLLALIPIHFISSELSGTEFNLMIIPSVALTIGVMWILDSYNIKLTKEEEIVAEQKKGLFGIPGLTDLSVSKSGPKSLDEVGNYDSTKAEIKESILMPLRHGELSVLYGIRPPKGILLFGPPGTGKTLLMSALAKELRMHFYYVKTSDILGQYLGESEKNISKLFDVARKNAPVVLFFDEIDSIGKKRDFSGYGESDQTVARALSMLLAEMDGMKEKEQVIVVAATNIPHQLDPALLRPGRFDKIIYMPPPDAKGREAIFKTVTKNLPLSDDVDFEKLAKMTERFTGADIANVCIEAARKAAPSAMEKGKVVPITMEDFVSVIKSVKPSTTFEMLDDYQKFRNDFERRTMREEIKPVEERVVTWADVIGMEDIKKALTEAIELPLLHEDELKKYNIQPIKGILLFGPPGTGKTYVVKAASHELNAKFISLTPSDLSRYGYENAVKLIRETFNRARENAPAVIFIDELESIAPSRDIYASKITEDIVSEILQQMDGLKNLKNVILVGATNKPSMIDNALLRPGRLDKIFFVGPPNEKDRAKHFQYHLKGVPGSETIDYEKLAEETEGFTPADIASICQEAKMQVVKSKISGQEEIPVTTEMVLEIISERTPSVTVPMLKEYIQFVKEYGERR